LLSLARMNILKDHEIGLGDVRKVGNKAMALSKMVKAGFDVPRFFVITSAVWVKYCLPLLQKSSLQAYMENRNDESLVLSLSSRISKTIESIEFDTQLSLDFSNLLQTYGFSKMATRSSGINEDLPNLSFAGIYDSFLNVSAETLEISIKKCWASAFSTKAIAYSKTVSDLNFFMMPVIVQQMMAFEQSGIVFTVDPVFHKNIVVEIASVSNPEPIVSGKISPSRFVFDRDLDLIEKHDPSNFSVSEIRKIIEVGLSVESEMGLPQDIEFGARNGEITILQTRPITTHGHQKKGKNT
jgi:phosphoenolpyruvate synthase/pyruvate phosphate dikinase